MIYGHFALLGTQSRSIFPAHIFHAAACHPAFCLVLFFCFVSWNISRHLSKQSTGLQPFLLMPDVKGWCFSLQHANLPFVFNEKNILKHESQGSQGSWQAPTKITTGMEVQGAQYIYNERKKEAGSFKHTQTHIRTSIMFHFKYTGARCICEWIIKGGG